MDGLELFEDTTQFDYGVGMAVNPDINPRPGAVLTDEERGRDAASAVTSGRLTGFERQHKALTQSLIGVTTVRGNHGVNRFRPDE